MVIEADPARMQAELLHRSELDQAIRHRVIDYEREHGTLPEDHPLHAEWSAIDEGNTAWLKAVIDVAGWPLNSDVGAEAALGAWLIAQHTPDSAFQEHCLALLRDAVASGEADPGHLAYTEDRVNMCHGRPQRYGSQWQTIAGHLELWTLEDPTRVDEWRGEVGLPPVEEWGPPGA